MSVNIRKHGELMMQFRNSVRANIEQLQSYGVATKYEDFLKEPQVEELPRMRDIGVEHFYSGEYVKEHGYQPLHGFSKHQTPYRGHLIEMQKLFEPDTTVDKKFRKRVEASGHVVDHVMILGPAGSGKSTIMKRFSRDADAGKISRIQDADRLVHALDARRFDPQKKIFVHEFLFRNMTCWPSDDAIQVGYEWMVANSEKVVLAVDSLDTLGYMLDNESVAISPDSRAYPATILYNIFIGNLFPRCKILSSSREHQVRKYKSELRPWKIISLAGLTTESIRSLVFGFLGNDEGDRVYEYLQTKFPELLILCQAPLFLVFSLVGLVGLEDGADGSRFVPKTRTGVMVKLLQSLIHSEHARALKQHWLDDDVIGVLKKMKALSYEGTKQGKVLFTEDDLKDVKLSPDEVADLTISVPGRGRSQREQKVLEGDSVTYVAHQSIEEMLCAMHIVEMTQEEFQSFVSEFLHQPYYAVIRRFICGLLLDPEVCEVASRQLVNDTKLTEIKEHLTRYLKEQLQQAKDEDLLELFYSLQEAGTGAKDIIPAKQRFTFNSSYSMVDMFTIGSVHCNTRECLDLDEHISSTEQTIQSTNGVDELRQRKIDKVGGRLNESAGLEGVTVLGQSVSRCYVRKLNISDCNLSSSEFAALIQVLEYIEFGEVNVSSNKSMEVSGITALGKLVSRCKVEGLNMSDCNLSSSQLQAFNQALDNTKISKVNVSCNKSMEVTGITALGQLVSRCKVEDLDMRKCELSPSQLQALNQALDTKIKQLVLGSPRGRWFFSPRDLEIDAICNLMKKVTQKLDLRTSSHLFGARSWTHRELNMLQNALSKLYPTELMINVGGKAGELQAVRPKGFHTSTKVPAKSEDVVKASFQYKEDDDDKTKGDEKTIDRLHDQETEDPAKLQKLATEFKVDLESINNSQELMELLRSHESDHPSVINRCVHQLSIEDYNLTKADMETLGNILKACNELEEIEFKNCGLDQSLLKILQNSLSGSNLEKTKLTVTITAEISLLFPEICNLLSVSGIRALDISANKLTQRDIEMLETSLMENQITDLSELDLSYNHGISPAGYHTLGKILKHCSTSKVRIVDCELTDDKLRELQRGVEKTQIDELNISCNTLITAGGFEIVAKITVTCGIQRLKISGCAITEEDIDGMNRIGGENSELQVKHLDVSYNPSMEYAGFGALGQAVKNYKVEDLHVAGCKLNEERAKNFLSRAGSHEMRIFNVRDNFAIGQGIVELAKITKQCRLQELNISECMLTTQQLRDFKATLEDSKLVVLNLSDQQRAAKRDYIEAICDLLPCVQKTLYIYFWKINKACVGLLQKQLNKLQEGELQIYLQENHILSIQKEKSKG